MIHGPGISTTVNKDLISSVRRGLTDSFTLNPSRTTSTRRPMQPTCLLSRTHSGNSARLNSAGSWVELGWVSSVQWALAGCSCSGACSILSLVRCVLCSCADHCIWLSASPAYDHHHHHHHRPYSDCVYSGHLKVLMRWIPTLLNTDTLMTNLQIKLVQSMKR